MKNKSLKILGLVLVVALVATLFCACDFLNFLNEITSVQITAGNGLEKVAEDEYTIGAGSNFSIKATWDNARVSSLNVDWHCVDESGKDSVEAYHGKELTHAYSIADVGKTYTYYAIVQEIKSNEIKITIVEAELSEPTISSTSHTISNGIVQQGIADGLTDVVLNASWNEKDISEDRNITVYWLVDGVTQEGENSKTFTYDVSKIDGECTVAIKVMLFENGIEKTSSQIKLVFVNSYALIDSVSLQVSGEYQTIGDAYYVQRNVDIDGGPSSYVSVACNILPLKADQSAECTYSITTSRGTTQKIGTSSTTILLTPGKNIIKATVQNVESRSIIVYYLDYAYESIPSDIKTAIEGTFIFDGDIHDSYISTQEDMNAFMGYAVSRHLTGIDFNVYLADVTFRSLDVFTQMIKTAVSQGVDESGNFKYTSRIVEACGTITFSEDSAFGKPTEAYKMVEETQQIKSYVRYSEVSKKRTSLPIDSAKDEAVYTSNDLYRVVSAGYKPAFANTSDGLKLQAIYQKARDVLLTYISDDMSELDKIAVIYDWIVSVVDYDYAVAECTDADAYKYNAFYLEGVFNDHRAVCDGKSKAFVLLCGMEGINAVRVCGYANEHLMDYPEKDRTNAAFGHAWNKVLVDVDGDGIREWYAVDTTWGDSGVPGDKVTHEYLNYAYFLKTDEELASTHLERTNAPKTTTQKYNVYQNTFITINGKSVCLYIDSVEDAKAILAYSKQNGKLAICVYVEEGILNKISYAGVALGNGQYVIYAKS